MMKLPKGEIEARVDWVVGILSIRGLERVIPISFPVVSSSVSRWGAGWLAGPTSSCSTSRSPISTASCGRRWRSKSAAPGRLGIPFIYVTHNQEEALSMSDRIAVVRGGRIEDFASRTDIYDHPKTAFIAQFVGRSNRFQGQAVLGEGTLAVRGDGFLIETATQTGIAEGNLVVAHVKNEKVQLRPSAPGAAAGANSIPATVRHVILRGAYAEYVMDWSGGELVASRPRRESEFTAGSDVVAFWDREDIDLFKATGGEA